MTNLKQGVYAALIVIGMAALATPAAAQDTTTEAPASTRFSIGSNDLFLPQAQRTETPVAIRVGAGGLFYGGGSGVLFGGGFGARPFNNRQVEVIGDVSFLRFEGFNGFYAAGNALYHFNTSDENFNPYAGAGIGIIHFPNDTQARFEVVGGLEFNKNGRYPMRPEIRFIFTRYELATVIVFWLEIATR